MTYHRRRVSLHTSVARLALALALLALASALAVAIISVARAHGEASWIMENRAYVRASGAHCCGPSDCARIADSDIETLSPGEWRVRSTGQVFRQSDKGVYPAVKPGFWGCKPGDVYLCFFFDGGQS